MEGSYDLKAFANCSYNNSFIKASAGVSDDLRSSTTPVGMYPNTGVAAVDLRAFPKCSGVLDVVYNPARTALILQAESLGIPCASGLYMLVAQAKRSSELFCDTRYDDGVIERITNELHREMQNIVIIGMPGSGKSTVAAALDRKSVV